MAFTDEILNAIRERVHFSEIVGEFLQLKRSGRNFVGLCPFHSEKTPSFSVRDEEASYHCFGCGKKGSVFNFVMEMRGFTFPEAVRYLAKQAGVTLPEETAVQAAADQHTPELRELTLAACEVFQDALWHSSQAKEYAKSRGMTPDTVKRFFLGFAPSSWEFIERRVLERIRAKGVLTKMSDERVRECLIELGLLKEDKAKVRVYDAFRERFIFPISRSDGRPIAFGGRTLSNEEGVPKYINSPESPLYSKRRSIYGLLQALPQARRDRHVYLVEGYMDVISLHQVGITAAVATCGTAVTQQHAEMLKRFVDGVTVLFDGDAAGKKAAAQCFPVFLNSGLDLEVVFLPDGHDPDSAARALPVEDLKALLEGTRQSSARVYLEYLIDEESGGDAMSPASSGRVARRYAQSVAQVRNAVEKEFLMRLGAEHLGVSADSFDELVREEAKRVAPRSFSSEGPPPAAVARRVDEIAAPPSVRHSSASRPASPRKAPPVSRTREQVDRLYRQLVVAVLSEPSIAPTILGFSELGPMEEPELESIRLRVFAFITEFQSSELPGVLELSEQYGASLTPGVVPSDPLQFGAAPSIRALLAAHGLGEHGLLEEAFRQCRTGGSRPGALAEESGGAASRLSGKLEVERIREAENSPQGEDERLQLAQEKLKKRRDLERLKSPARP